MPRRPRLQVEGGVFHVYCRVASGEAVFADPEEAIAFVDLVRFVKERDGWTLFAWCVMSNHYHLALRTRTILLSKGMHYLQGQYGRRFNRSHGRTGGVWQSRYQSRLVEDQQYLDQLILYIHLNPVRAGAVDDPAEYPFSGHKELVRTIRKPLVDVDESLLCFGDSRQTARRAYSAASRASLDEGWGSGQSPGGGMWAARGDPLDVDPAPIHVDVVGCSTDLERPRLDPGAFLDLLAGMVGIKRSVLASRTRDRSVVRARRLIVVLGRERWAQPTVGLAAALGKSADVVSYLASQGVRQRLEDAEFASELDRLDGALANAVNPPRSSAGTTKAE